ncbi:hypothetical protein AHAS_Ahas04G0196700 [Arachis hypogaea]
MKKKFVKSNNTDARNINNVLYYKLLYQKCIKFDMKLVVTVNFGISLTLVYYTNHEDSSERMTIKSRTYFLFCVQFLCLHKRRTVALCCRKITLLSIDFKSEKGGLESITITCMMTNHDEIFPAIGKYCKGITELKITSLNFRALCCVLENLKHLKIVNLYHSLIMDKPDPSTQLALYTFCQLQNQWPIHCLRKVLFCLSKRCVICKNKFKTSTLISITT